MVRTALEVTAGLAPKEHLTAPVTDLVVVLALAATAVTIVAVGGPLLQVKPLLAVQALAPRLDRLDPIRGLKQRLFSGQAWFEFAKSAAKLIVIGAALGFVVRGRLPALLATWRGDPIAALAAAADTIVVMTATVAGAFLGLAVLDAVYQHARHRKNQRMTLQEMREERKEDEGTPEQRAARKRMHREIMEGNTIRRVETSDVLLANPDARRVCAALRPRGGRPARRRQGRRPPRAAHARDRRDQRDSRAGGRRPRARPLRP